VSGGLHICLSRSCLSAQSNSGNDSHGVGAWLATASLGTLRQRMCFVGSGGVGEVMGDSWDRRFANVVALKMSAMVVCHMQHGWS
jgi:hypothetical protein